MKTLFVYLMLGCLLVALPGATPAVPSSTDVWLNTDPNTRSITRIEFTPRRARVRILAACSPNDCDWGSFSVRDNDPQGHNTPSEGHPYEVTVDQSMARREIRFIEFADHMTFSMRSVFKDNRPARETTGRLKRQF